ncbi:MAG: hypothetical protein ACJ8BW_30245 [Ktedonobacteraceae bacterium]
MGIQCGWSLHSHLYSRSNPLGPHGKSFQQQEQRWQRSSFSQAYFLKIVIPSQGDRKGIAPTI